MTSPKRILIVDDTPANLQAIGAMVRALGHEPETAKDGIEALSKVKSNFDLILMDVAMPGMDGYEVTRCLRRDPETASIPIIMVTGLNTKQDRLRAVEAGANDFMAKPIDWTEMRVRTSSLLKMKEAQDALKQHQRVLEETVEKRTAALHLAMEEMAAAHRKTYEAQLDTIRRLAFVSEYKDMNTAAHILRMSRYSTLLAGLAGLPPNEVDAIHIASPMHDVGKIGIPDAILTKPGQLTDVEWEVMRQHTLIGDRLLEGSASELLQAGRVIALCHHERWDGSGYPHGLAGEEIPLYGRICAIADVFDAVTSDRPYRAAMSNDAAFELLRTWRGKHFDPALADLFLAAVDEVLAIQSECRTVTGPDWNYWTPSAAGDNHRSAG